MSMFKPGKYEAKIVEYGVVQNSSGKEQVKVTFDVKVDSTHLHYSWFGGLDNPKGQEITTKNLFTMGANEKNLDKVSLGLEGGVLNTDKVYELVIEDNTYNNQTSSKIKYINDPSKPRAQTQAFVKSTNSLSALKGVAAGLIASGEISAPDNKKDVDNTGVGF